VSANDESRSRSCAPLRPLCLCGFNGPGYRGATGNTEAKEIIGHISFAISHWSFKNTSRRFFSDIQASPRKQKGTIPSVHHSDLHLSAKTCG